MLFNRSHKQNECKENMAERNMATKADTGSTVVAEQQPEVRVGHNRWDSFTASLMEGVQDADMYWPKFKVVPVNNGTKLYKPPWVLGVFSDIRGCVVVGSCVVCSFKAIILSVVMKTNFSNAHPLWSEALCHENPRGRKIQCRMCLMRSSAVGQHHCQQGLAMKGGDRDRKSKHREMKLGGGAQMGKIFLGWWKGQVLSVQWKSKKSKRIKGEYAWRHRKSAHVHVAKMGAGDLNGVQSTAVWRKCYCKDLEMIGTGRKFCYEKLQNHLSCSLLITIVGRKKIYKEATYSPVRGRGGSHGCLFYTKISTSPHTGYFWFYGIAEILCHWVQALAAFGPEIRKSPYVISSCWVVRLSLSVRNVCSWSL